MVVDGKVTKLETYNSIFVAGRLKKPRGGGNPPPPRWGLKLKSRILDCILVKKRGGANPPQEGCTSKSNCTEVGHPTRSIFSSKHQTLTLKLRSRIEYCILVKKGGGGANPLRRVVPWNWIISQCRIPFGAFFHLKWDFWV